MIHLLLLGTAGCHLCEQAQTLLADSQALVIEPVDIAEHEHWQARYAVRIPVLYHPDTKKELGWPFDQTDVNHFIEALNRQPTKTKS
jgi:hypothetical protein